VQEEPSKQYRILYDAGPRFIWRWEWKKRIAEAVFPSAWISLSSELKGCERLAQDILHRPFHRSAVRKREINLHLTIFHGNLIIPDNLQLGVDSDINSRTGMGMNDIVRTVGSRSARK
jgi:hypothetical protein